MDNSGTARVAVGRGNAHFICIRQVSSDAADWQVAVLLLPLLPPLPLLLLLYRQFDD